MRKLGDFASERSVRAGSGTQREVLSVTKHQGIVRASEYFDKQVHGRDTSNYKIVEPGDFAYATIHLDEGSLGFNRYDAAGVVSPMYTVFRADSTIDREFLFLALKSEQALGYYPQLRRGTVNRRGAVSFADLAATYIRLPPLDEQRRIAAVLSAIDAAHVANAAVVEATERVQHELAATSMEAGWPNEPLGQFIVRGPDNGLYKHKTEYGSGVCIVRIGDFAPGDFIDRTATLQRLRASAEEIARYALAEGDIVVNRVNSLSHIGKAALVRDVGEPTVFESNMMRFAVDRDRLDPTFAFLAVTSPLAREHFRKRAKHAVAQASVNQGDLRDLHVPVPPLSDQRRIVETFIGIRERYLRESRVVSELARVKATVAARLLSTETSTGAP